MWKVTISRLKKKPIENHSVVVASGGVLGSAAAAGAADVATRAAARRTPAVGRHRRGEKLLV